MKETVASLAKEFTVELRKVDWENKLVLAFRGKDCGRITTKAGLDKKGVHVVYHYEITAEVEGHSMKFTHFGKVSTIPTACASYLVSYRKTDGVTIKL